jgi:hypothetical protein
MEEINLNAYSDFIRMESEYLQKQELEEVLKSEEYNKN